MSGRIHGSFYEEREQIILDLLQKKGRITVAEAAELTGLSVSTIRLQFQRFIPGAECCMFRQTARRS